MKINYGISMTIKKPHKRKRIITENHSIEIDVGDKSFAESGNKIRKEIIKEITQKYPGWSLIGYCEKEVL